MFILQTILSGCGALPLLVAWICLFMLSRDFAARRVIADDWSLHWAFASTAWGVLLTLLVELTSLFGSLNGPTLLAAWLLIDAGLVFAVIRQRRRYRCKEMIAGLRKTMANCPWDARVSFGLVGVLVFILFGVALLTPTTNWDSLTYHLPRMLHWLQQGTVDHFATNNFRQIEFPPWASYTFLHLFLFTGNDHLLNLMQWCAMVSTLMVVPYIVASLARWTGVCWNLDSVVEGPRCWRMIALTCLIVATLPIGVIESITTQNDYAATFWVCCALAFGLALIANPENRAYAVGVGAALGLGTLTKSTVFVYAAPFVLALGIWWMLRVRRVFKFRIAFIATVSFAALNAPHMLRNQAATGAPLGSPEIFKLERNERISLAVTGSNLIRNLSLNGNSGLVPVTRSLNRGLAWLHSLTGFDLNDPASTYRGCKFFFREKFLVLDSYTSNTWHVMLFGVAMAVALANLRSHSKALLYAGLVVAGVLLFCAYLKWQWWHSRLHLGFLVMFAPFAGLVLARKLPRFGVMTTGLLLTAFAMFSLVKNQSRPFLSNGFTSLPRERQYMAVEGAHLNEHLSRVADIIVASGSEKIGLHLAFDDAEYPLWVMLRNRGFQGEIHHVTRNSERVDVVVSSPDPQRKLEGYPFSHTFGYYTVLWKEQPIFENERPYSALK